MRQQIHNLSRRGGTIHDYVQDIKKYVDAMATINAHMPNDDLVDITLRSLGKEYKSFETSISIQSTNYVILMSGLLYYLLRN